MKIRVTRKINASVAPLWEYLSDYSNIHRFHPLLTDSHFIEGHHECGIGTERKCIMKDGSYIDEQVIDWKENSHYTVKVLDTTMPIKNGAVATLGVKKISKNLSEAYMEMNIKPKNIFMAPMIYMMFKFSAGPRILKGLDALHQAEYGALALS